MDKTMSGVYAAMPYLPIGGFQLIIGPVGAIINKDKFLKFHYAQGFAYWLLALLSIYPVLKIVDMTIQLQNAGMIILVYVLGVFLILPLMLGGKALLGHVFYLPLIGKPIAKIVGFENAGSDAQT